MEQEHFVIEVFGIRILSSISDFYQEFLFSVTVEREG